MLTRLTDFVINDTRVFTALTFYGHARCSDASLSIPLS